MAQDWFADNAPTQQQGNDWFAANAPQAAPKEPGMLEPHGDWTDVLRGAGAGVKQMVMHPLDTAKGMAQQIVDVLPSYGPGGIPLPNKEGVEHAQQQAQHIIDNPAYAAGEVIGPAALTYGASKLLPKVPIGMARAGLMGKTPVEAYESALKPSPSIPAADRTAMVNTALENELPVSKGGLEKIGNQIEVLNQAIKDEIAQDPNRPIDPNAVATRADLAKAKFSKQVNKQQDLNAIEASKQQFLDEQGRTPAIPPKPTGLLDAQGNPIMSGGTPAQPAPPMNAIDAQEMKQGTYKVLKGKYGEQGSASTEAQKALARGLKEEIATQFPEITKLNAAESRLLDLQPVLERAVNRISNHQVIGIGTPVAGVAAEAMTGSPGIGKVAMVLKGVLDNPNVKSRLAIAVSKSSKIPYSQALQRVQAYSTGLATTAAASNVGTPNQSDESDPAE